jgi:hypothetical protein
MLGPRSVAPDAPRLVEIIVELGDCLGRWRVHDRQVDAAWSGVHENTQSASKSTSNASVAQFQTRSFQRQRKHSSRENSDGIE